MSTNKIKKMNSRNRNLDFHDELSVSKNWKIVRYDGYSYNVIHLIKLDPGVEKIKHKCDDNCELEMDLETWIVEIRKKKYYVDFCNKCKTLFVKPL